MISLYELVVCFETSLVAYICHAILYFLLKLTHCFSPLLTNLLCSYVYTITFSLMIIIF